MLIYGACFFEYHSNFCLCLQLVHYVNRDSSGLANDFLSLGFIPDGTDIQLVADALRASFGNETRQSNDFQVIFHNFHLSYGIYLIFYKTMLALYRNHNFCYRISTRAHTPTHEKKEQEKENTDICACMLI